MLLDAPVESVWQVSHDPTLTTTLQLASGKSITALEAQWQYLEWVEKYLQNTDAGELYSDVLPVWEKILTDLETDVMTTADRLDWVAKLRVLEGYRERDGLEWSDPKLRLLDLQYHDIDPERGIYYKLAGAGRMQRLFTDEEITAEFRRVRDEIADQVLNFLKKQA